MIDETEKQYQQLVEALPIATLAIRDGCLIYANQECAKIFGFSDPEGMIGLPALDFVAPESQQLITERIKRFEEGQDNPTTEMELLRKDGSRFIAESTSVSILLEGERVGGNALRDITQTKESEIVFQEHLRFQKLVSGVSAKFINPSEDNFEQTVQNALAEIAEYFEVDAVRLYRLSLQGDVLELRNSWRSPALAPPKEMPGLKNRKYPNFAAHYSKGESVVFSRYEDSPDWPEMREVMKFLGVKAGIGVPLEVDGSGVDVFAMDKVLSEHVWPEDIVEHSKAIGRVILGAMRRREAAVELQKRIRFQELISRISTKFINPSEDEFEQAVQDALAEIAAYFDADAVRLFKLSHQGVTLEARVSWRSPSLAPPKEIPELFKKQAPSFAAHYAKGNPLVFGRYDGYPEWEEWGEIMTFLGIEAGVRVPLEVDDLGVTAFAIDKVLSDEAWPEEIVEHMKAVGRVILSAVRRRKAEIDLHDSMDEIKQLKDRLKQENIYLRQEARGDYQHDKIIGDSEAIKKALVKARQVADTETTVLITGETGTGKELFAQAIHDLSGRKDQLMVKLNCAALPPTLVEGELFGREKGAYTGAMTSQVGRFELADGSTIFLDEIGELTPDLQVKLLRVIEDGTFERLGSSNTISTDVRIIAATNSDLQKMISEGRFREDLYYRLNVFPIRVPPLRERPSDVPQLAWTFIRELESRMGKRIQTIPEDVMVGLIGYPWPGNVRELRNVIEHAMILSPGPVLQAYLPEDKTAMDTEETHGMTLDEMNRKHILRALEQTDWRIQGKDGAAQLMGVKPNTLRSRMEKLGIKKSG